MFFFEAVFTKICLICYHLFYVSDPLPNLSAGRVLLTCGQFIPWVFCHTYLVPRALSNRFQDGWDRTLGKTLLVESFSRPAGVRYSKTPRIRTWVLRIC